MKKVHIVGSTHKNMRGFEYLLYSALSVMLLCAMILLPLAPVFASEDESTIPTPETSTETEVEEVSQSIAEEEVDETEENQISELSDITLHTNEVSESESDNILDTSEENGSGEMNDTLIENGEVASDAENAEPGTPLDEGVTPEGEEVIPNASTTPPENVPEVIVETPEQDLTIEEVQVPDIDLEVPEEPVSEPTSESTSTTSDDSAPETPVVNIVTNDENRFSFSKDECAMMGDGSFYCVASEAEPEVLDTNRTFSATDEDGDKEIYIERDGELIKITDNNEDDDAPYFDETSNTIVWHRLIDGRYQVISYDIDKQKEEQITFDRYNNMHPSRFADALVWQGWVGNDWEIFMLQNDELTMITDNTLEDISPSINGSHVVWQAFEGNAWRMKVYDIRMKTISTIEDTEGGSIQNPRFVLVYDTKFQSGDVETRGYDLKSGEVVPLSATPTKAPNEIPNPDQTGENRALVSPPVQPKTKLDGENDGDVVPVIDPPPPNDIAIPPYQDIDVQNDLNVSSTTSDVASDVLIPDLHIPHIEQNQNAESIAYIYWE